MALREENVLRLDVAMQHAHAVRVGERIGDGGRDRERPCRVQPPLLQQSLAQRAALDVRHHVIEKALGFTRIVQGQDVRVCEPGGDLNLFEEPVHAERSRQIGAQDLEGDFAEVFPVVREVDRSHPAAPELAADFVPFGECRL